MDVSRLCIRAIVVTAAEAYSIAAPFPCGDISAMAAEAMHCEYWLLSLFRAKEYALIAYSEPPLSDRVKNRFVYLKCVKVS